MAVFKVSSENSRTSTRKTAEELSGSNNTSAWNASQAAVIKDSRHVSIGRCAFVGFLAVIAALLGWLGYFLLNSAQHTLVDEQYYSMTSNALETVRVVAKQKLQYGTKIMANVAGHSFPNAESWPYVWIDGYWDIVENVVPTSLGTGMNLAPLVDPAVTNVTDFEDFVYGKYAEVFPNYTLMGARSHFGKGIWVWDPSIDTVDNRYHDTTGVSIHGSDRLFLAPKVQGEWVGVIDSEWVMMNVHGFNNQGKAVDAVMDCVEDRAISENPHTINCQGLSPMESSKPPHEHLGMFGFIATPVYPAHEPTKCVGFIFGLVYFSELLEQMYPRDFEGIDCVFNTEDQVFTYSLEDGAGVFKGEGDLHDPKYDDYQMDTVLIDPDTMSKSSETYYCTCYPNDDLGVMYSTGAPTYAAVGAIFIIIFISTLFLLYDRCVRKEFHARKELLEAKRQFVRFVSHEVRTPLNSVGMGLTLMKEEMAQSLGYKSSDELMESPSTNLNELKKKEPFSSCLTSTPKAVAKRTVTERQGAKEWFTLADEIQNNTQCAVDVLNDLLNYDKIENGSLSLELSVIPIWKLVEKTVNEFQLPMTSKHIKLHFDLPEQTPKVLNQKVVGDVVRLTQVLRNLISNAIKFTPESGDIYIQAKSWKLPHQARQRKFQVGNGGAIEDISCKSSGNLVLSVKDTGAGMSSQQLKKLFQKGVQFNVNELQHGNGSGLGLYISKGIVQQHEGQLVCDSEGLRLGTTFTMTVPIYELPQTDPLHQGGGEKQPGELEDLTYEDSKLRILIVDDALSNRKLLGRLLTKKGHENEQAEDGDVAVEMVKDAEQAGKPYDLVLMDYEMPIMNGPEAARLIRENGSDVFIVGVTGNIMPEDVEHYHQCGANVILAKPFKMPELEELIVEHNITGNISCPATKAEVSEGLQEPSVSIAK